MKTLYIECNMGVAGDMLMGALYELCDQKEKFLSDMNQAFAPYGVTLSVEPAVKCGISGTHMRVAVHGEEERGRKCLKKSDFRPVICLKLSHDRIPDLVE